MTSTMRFDKWENSLGQPYGTVLQVVSVTKTDATFSTSSTSFVDITGLSASITPTSASSKVLVLGSLYISASGTPITSINLVRDSTSIGQGDADGSRTRGIAAGRSDSSFQTLSITVNFLDSPNTTSATTYKFQMSTSSSTSFLNRTADNTDQAGFPRISSTITLMEIAQ
jgi:hypothetical protein